MGRILLLLLILAAQAAYADPPTPDLEPEDASFEELEQEFKVPQQSHPKKTIDPLRGYNRFMFGVNDRFYFWVVKPVAKGYSFLVPQQGRIAIGRAFHNFHFPLRFVNSFLQLKFKQSGIELGRFLINSTVGIGGFFDPAGRYLRWHSQEEDFGQTLGRYGAGRGFPIVLPVLGFSNLRDMIGLAVDFYTHPLVYLASAETSLIIGTGEGLNRFSLDMGTYESLKRDALDPYTFFRDAYEQNRNEKIRE